MSKINDLIKKLCVDGVEYKSLNEVFTLFSGMTGVTNKWAEEGNCHFIDYMNAYKNNKIDITKLPYATVKNTKQTTLIQGDLLLTSASELPDECAIASVIEDKIQDGIFMDDHLFGLRLKDEYKKILNTTFVSYYLNSKPFRCNLFKAVRGVTRFYISNKDYMKLTIPIPPIDVQKGIVQILDKFCKLEEKLALMLEEELELRKVQYEFWRRKLLDGKDTKVYKLSDLVELYLGLTYTPKYVDSGIKFISSTNISKGYLDLTNTKYISQDEYTNCTSNAKPKKGDVLYVRVGSNLGHPVIYDLDEEICIFVSVGFARVKNSNILSNRYLKHWMDSDLFMKQVKAKTINAPKANLNATWMKDFEISVPNINEQIRIVSLLDEYDSLVNDITEDLPAEIELRRQQYEYYRNKLLSFKEI